MKKYISGMLTLLIIVGIMPLTSTYADIGTDDGKINISPVVQLISYKGEYGKYVEMLGW